MNAVVEAKQVKTQYEKTLENILKESREIQAKKMYDFCDVLVREFKYMNKLQEDKILHQIGFTEKREIPPGTETKPWELYNEVMSVKSNPAAADYMEDQQKTQPEKATNNN